MRDKSQALRRQGKSGNSNSRLHPTKSAPASSAPDSRSADASEDSFRALAEKTSDPLVLLERDATVRYSNTAAASMLGYSQEGFEGRSIFENVHVQDSDQALRFFQSSLDRPGIPVAADFRFRHRGDGWRSVAMVAVNRLANPGLQAVIVSYHDITDRQQAEETRARLAAIVESSDDAIIGETLDGIITSWNMAAERLYGYTAAEALGRPISITVPSDRMEELADYMSRVRRGSMVDHLETVRLRKDGIRLDVSITLSPIRDEQGNVIGLSKSSRDITERRRFEAELWRKNIELEIASRAKDAFLASMSHELRTPLNSIIGFTGTMLMKLPGELTEDQERQLGLIQFSARHLLSLINDLLNLAKVQSGKAELQFERVECRAIVEEVAATLRPGAEAKGLVFETGPVPDLELHTDRRALIQILLNLAGNAIKFTEEGTIRMDVLRSTPEPGKRAEILLKVTDTGLGIRREDQSRLFRAFEQFHMQKSSSDPGSGLGLHLSQRMATLLGGRIEVSSEPGKGSIFTLRIPGE